MKEQIYYILENKKVKLVDNIFEWTKWFVKNKDKRAIKKEIIGIGASFPYRSLPAEKIRVKLNRVNLEGYYLSTVFLGIDHSLGQSERPILFETMVFGGPYDGYTRRYSLYNEAIKGHEETKNMILYNLNKNEIAGN